MQNFINLCQSAAKLLLFVQKNQDGGRRNFGIFLFNILAHMYVGPQT